jgi:hypothetical protein
MASVSTGLSSSHPVSQAWQHVWRHLCTDSKNDITVHLRRQSNQHRPAPMQRRRRSLLILPIPASKYRVSFIVAASLTRKHTSLCHLSSHECKQYGNVATIHAGLGEIRIGLFSFILSTCCPKFMRTQICVSLDVTQSLHRCRLSPRCGGFFAGMQASRRSRRSASMQKRRVELDAGWKRRRRRCRDCNSPPGRSRYI